MKQILMTVLATIAGLWVAVLWLGVMGIVDLNKLQEVLSSTSRSQIEEVIQATGTEVSLWGIDTILCEGTLNPEKQPDGSFKCVPSENLTTECMGPDGEAYKDGEKKTFYKVAEKTEENKDQEITCESVEKICGNGNFTIAWSQDPTEKSEYAHLDCKIIDRTKTDEIPCKTDEGLEVPPGSKQIRFLKNEVAADEDCIHIEEYCAADGKWRTNFPTHNMVKCDFKGSFTTEYVKENPEKVFSQDGELNEIAKGEIAIDPTKKSCTTPWGETIKHGEKIISFRDKIVRFTNECHSRTHTCVDGTLDFVEAYDYPTCTIEGPDACIIEETKVTVFHDSDKKLYAKGKYVNGVWTCPEQIRHCFDKKLDGDDAYIYETCQEPNKAKTTAGPARCPSPYVGESAVLDHGRSGIGYFKNNVGRLQSCDGEVDWKINKVAVSCEYGTIQPIGNSVKIRRSCSKWTPKDCSAPRWATVKHGTSIMAYSVAGVSYGGSCSSETRVCNDGVLDGSFQFQACNVGQPTGCSSPCGNVAHGESVQSFSTANVAFWGGETCSQNKVTSICKNGSFSPSVADFCSCKVDEPKDCLWTAYWDIKHGATVTRHTPVNGDQVGNDLEWGRANECKHRSVSCGNGQLYGNLLSHPEATLGWACPK